MFHGEGVQCPREEAECRSDRKHGRVFVDLSGKEPVLAMAGEQYSMIFCDDAARLSKEYFVKHTSDPSEALEQYLADTRDIVPPDIIRSDDASELNEGRQVRRNL